MTITFELGMNRDRVWREGSYQLRSTAQRVDWPNAHAALNQASCQPREKASQSEYQ